MTATTYQAIAMVAYFVTTFAIGGWAYLRTDNFDDYMLVDRDFNLWVAAPPAGASDISGRLLMELPGTLYISGLVEGWIAAGLTPRASTNRLLVAPRLRAYTEVANNPITAPSFLDNRFHDTYRLLHWSSGLIILVYFTFYVSSSMVAGGRFLESPFGMDYRLGMVIVAAITAVYTPIGGFLTVSYTDFVQGVMTATALVTVPVAGVIRLGGLSNLTRTIVEVDPHYWVIRGPTTTLFGVISALAWELGYFGQPHIIIRLMAIRNPREAVAGGIIGIGWMLFAMLGVAGTAIVGVATYQHDKKQLVDPGIVFITLGELLSHLLAAGFMPAATLAAIMSTISSQLFVISSVLIEDLYGSSARTRGEKISGNRMMLYSCMAVFVIALVAAVVARNPGETILDLVAFAWTGFGASFGPTILLSLYWKRLSAMGAFVGMITGAVVVMIWGNVFGGLGGVFDLYEIMSGFVGNLVVAVAASRMSQPSKETSAEFDAAAAALWA